jgi:kojibiose phosphorylase
MTGPGYRGHVFWDTEVFVLPFFVWTHPPTARALLAYRYRTLPQARAKAARFGYRGALYPWESADTGEEVTPATIALPDGTELSILTGLQEHHISADVAWATWQYWLATADDEFLVAMGAEMIVETARFWASRARAGGDGRRHIDEVIGPDEYHEGVDDNAYTNVLARWNLRRAAEVCALVPTLDPAAWAGLSSRLDIGPDEMEQWEVVAAGLVDGFDGNALLYEQFAGFFDLEDIRAADLAERPFSGEMVVGVERLGRTQVVKQADVLMIGHMLPDEVPPHVVAANFDYYEPRTCHGSSLSPAIHAAVAARVGDLEAAMTYFRASAGLDLHDHMGNAAKGVHIATMGGLWQAAVFGFGGVQPERAGVRIDPHLPGGWDRLAFPVRWRGTLIDVEVTSTTLCLRLDGPAAVAVGRGSHSMLGPGPYVAHREGDGWSAAVDAVKL